MRYKYRTVDAYKPSDITTVERLVKNGWKIIETGFNCYLLEKPIIIKGSVKNA